MFRTNSASSVSKAVWGSGLKTQDKRAYLKPGSMDHIRGKQCQTERELALTKGFPVAIYSSHSDKNRFGRNIWFVCERIVDTDNICEEDPPSLGYGGS